MAPAGASDGDISAVWQRQFGRDLRRCLVDKGFGQQTHACQVTQGLLRGNLGEELRLEAPHTYPFLSHLLVKLGQGIGRVLLPGRECLLGALDGLRRNVREFRKQIERLRRTAGGQKASTDLGVGQVLRVIAGWRRQPADDGLHDPIEGRPVPFPQDTNHRHAQ